MATKPGETEVALNAEELYNLFAHRTDWYAVQKDDGTYRAVNALLTAKHFQQHLDGDITLGVYTTSPDNTVKFVCYDIDSHDTSAAYALLHRLDTACTIESSGNKGWHVWQHYDTPANAAVARAAAAENVDFIIATYDLPVEFFPKQDTVGDGLGNLVKVPLGIHRKSMQRSVIKYGDFQQVKPPELQQAAAVRATAKRANSFGNGDATWLEELFDGDIQVGKRNESLNKLIYWLRARSFPEHLVDLIARDVNTRLDESLPEEEMETLLRERDFS